MLSINNQYTYLRKELQVRFYNFLFENENREAVNRIPYDMIPADEDSRRCCIYKDREMIKYRLMAMMGYRFEEKFDESSSLSEQYTNALENPAISLPPLTVIKAACSACKKEQYSVTEFCKGCLARPCQTSCPRDAVTVKKNKAIIDPEKCINCGKCRNACPYSAIVYTPVPCEEVCPVAAIDHNDGISIDINKEKCISCGKCTRACPFGAIVERSHMLPVTELLKKGEDLTLLLAPSILNQLPGGESRIVQALKALGFTSVYQLKKSAEIVAFEESKELLQRREDGLPFMTSSCCPAYVEAVKKHLPDLDEYVSHTASPMVMGGNIVKKQNKKTITIFVGPCLAKKVEAFHSENVNYVLSFEELGTLLVSRGIEINDFSAIEREGDYPLGLGFARSGGVARAVEHFSEKIISTRGIDGITSKSLKLLGSFVKRPPGKDLIEVMACEGGCEKGPCALF